MAMIAIKKGVRISDASIVINEKSKTMTIVSGFLRKYNYNPENAKYLRLGFDKDTKEIGIEFLKDNDESDGIMKLTYAVSNASASLPIRSLMTLFALDIKDIVGVYKDGAIIGPTIIEGFAKNGFLLKLNKREKNERIKSKT